MEELFSSFNELIIPKLENVVNKILPKFLFSPFLKSIYKSIPFVVLLFLKINLGIAWAGIFLLGYLIFRIINIIGLFLLYIWRAIKNKYYDNFNNKVMRILNVLYIPVKVAKAVILLIILGIQFKNHIELFFLLPICIKLLIILI